MDFTKIPRVLIYRQRQYLEEFNIHREKTLNASLYRLLRRHLYAELGQNSYQHMILTMMNEAYYLCTILTMDKQADSHFREYIETVMADSPYPEGITTMCQRMVYAMCYVYLEKPAVRLHEVRTVRRHLRNCSYEYMPLMMSETADVVLPGLREFSPVALTENLLVAIDWEEVTMGFDAEAIEYILNNLGSSDAEKRMMVEAIYASLGNSGNMSKVPYKVDGLLYKAYQAYGGRQEDLLRQGDIMAATKWQREQLTAQVSELGQEIIRLQKRIRELEQENMLQRTAIDEFRHDNTGRTFTLTEIVDYCKDCVEWGDAKDIANMLNTLVGSKITSEEKNLIDSIKKHFSASKQVPLVVEKPAQINVITGDNATIQR